MISRSILSMIFLCILGAALIRSAAGNTFYRELQMTEEDNVNGTAIAQCSATIVEYDANGDGEIDREEYVTLVMNQLGVEDYEPGSTPFIELPLQLVSKYCERRKVGTI
mmetsp:Transcript_14252/g.18636  ORF Transcript_14252/g.18636 Transcript_14252/m.18636 type:complete len:109 (+) Transcript_14252:79-405(+)